jgi:hypothetical protein
VQPPDNSPGRLHVVVPGGHPHLRPHPYSVAVSLDLVHHREMDVEFPAHPAVIQDLQVSPDVSGHAYAEITVQIEQPSVPGSPVTSSAPPFRLSPVRDQTHRLATRHQLPSTDSVNPSRDSSRSRERNISIVWADGCAHRSQGFLQASRHEPSFAFPGHSVSRVSIQITATAASNTQPDRSLRLMHSEQVSRYVNPGNV